jgi:hypothetical protein
MTGQTLFQTPSSLPFFFERHLHTLNLSPENCLSLASTRPRRRASSPATSHESSGLFGYPLAVT